MLFRSFSEGELSSAPLSDLGASYAWRSPTAGGGDALGLDCFLSVSSKVFSVRAVALSSNIRFFRASVVKGPLCKMYPPRVVM